MTCAKRITEAAHLRSCGIILANVAAFDMGSHMGKGTLAVLGGGHASEHDVSLLSAKNMGRSLKERGYTVLPVLIGESGLWNVMGEDYLSAAWPARIADACPEALRSGHPLSAALELRARGVEVVVIGLHGRGGEDGSIQGVLAVAGFTYTGPGGKASALAIDKINLKRILMALDLPTANYDVIRGHEVLGPGSLEAVLRRIMVQLGHRVVVKAPSLGSSVHVYMPKTEDEALDAARRVLEVEDRVLVEQCIEGEEFTVPVLGTRQSPHPLPVIAIKPRLAGWFDRNSKYLQGGAEAIVPAPISRPLARRLQELAVRVHQVIGARGVTRTDFIVDRQGNPHILELNTLPGMTDASLVPKAAAAAGLQMGDLLEELIAEARAAREDACPTSHVSLGTLAANC